jgi:broad specificity phosphatase PhoE
MTFAVRQRRPGRGTAAASLILLVLSAFPSTAGAQGLVIAVRHAERADGGAGAQAMTGAPDPLLSAAGEARAARLAGLLAESGITSIFTTEFRRTQDTARPLAAKLGLTPVIVKGSDTAALLARLKSSHASDIILVVGHSNTLPAIVKALTGREVTIADSQYDDLFVLVPATGTMSRLKY